jgi:outer membrane biosynthesis protein TonB
MNYTNSESAKVPSQKAKGLAGTAIIHFSVLLLLAFVGFKAPNPADMDRGILVNFGTDETGSGQIEPSPSSYYEEISIPNLPVPQAPKKDESLLTQNYDNESPLVKKVVPDNDRKKKERIEAARIRRAEIEAENLKKAQEEAERKKIEQDQKRTTDIISRTKNAFTNGKNSGTTSTGEGITGGQGNQGDPNGSVDSKIRGKNTGTGTSGNGISFDLEGRNYKTLPTPKYTYQVEGRVFVEINVDRNGNVVLAIPGTKGSTTLDDDLLAAAKEAALKSKFDPKPNAPSVQKGTIIYNFILK